MAFSPFWHNMKFWVLLLTFGDIRNQLVYTIVIDQKCTITWEYWFLTSFKQVWPKDISRATSASHSLFLLQVGNNTQFLCMFLDMAEIPLETSLRGCGTEMFKEVDGTSFYWALVRVPTWFSATVAVHFPNCVALKYSRHEKMPWQDAMTRCHEKTPWEALWEEVTSHFFPFVIFDLQIIFSIILPSCIWKSEVWLTKSNVEKHVHL